MKISIENTATDVIVDVNGALCVYPIMHVGTEAFERYLDWEYGAETAKIILATPEIRDIEYQLDARFAAIESF